MDDLLYNFVLVASAEETMKLMGILALYEKIGLYSKNASLVFLNFKIIFTLRTIKMVGFGIHSAFEKVGFLPDSFCNVYQP